MAPPNTNYSKQNVFIPETPNTKMFRDLSKTDPNATKPFQKPGGFSGTAIDPAWRWMRLTEYFGPAGQGWGAEQLAFHFAEGMAFVCVRIWYRVPNEDGTMGTGEQCWTPPQWGGSELVKARKGYSFVSDEALKMAMTDAMGKCAGMYLGLGADIYLGSFEDDKYREESEVFYKVKANPELTSQAIAKSETDLAEKLEAVTDLDALDDLWNSGMNARIKEIGTADKAARLRMIAAFSEKKNQIIRKNEQGDAADPAVSDGENEDADPPEDRAHQPSLQEMADHDQEEHTRQLEREEASAKPAHPAKTTQGDLTPEKIKLFEEWVSRKLTGVKDARELNALWDKDCAPRMLLIKDLDENVHRRISAAYVKRMNELGGGFKRVSSQS